MTVWGFFNPIIQFITSHPDAAVLNSFRLSYSAKTIDVKKQKIQLQGIGYLCVFQDSPHSKLQQSLARLSPI